MGRLSYTISVSISMAGLAWPGSTFPYLVSKSTHSCAYGLLDHVETEIRTESALAGSSIVAQTISPIHPPIIDGTRRRWGLRRSR